MRKITVGDNKETVMAMTRHSLTAARWLAATALGTVLAMAPVSVTFHSSTGGFAWAKGGGEGGGHGGGRDGGGGKDNGGGNDKGDKGGRDNDGGRGDKADRGDSDKGDRGSHGRDVGSRANDVNAGTANIGRDRDSGRDRGRDISRGFDRGDRGRDISRSDRRDGRDVSRSVSDRRDSSGKNTLGNLNAAHASANARAHASPNSMVGRIAAYENQMQAALAIQDRSARNAAIVTARERLAESANKPLTAGNIARVDSMLGLRGASPQLGAVSARDFGRRDRDFDRRDFDRISLDDRRDGRRDHDLRGGFGRGLGVGNAPVDPARIDARAALLDARGDRIAAEIRTSADRRAADTIARAEARAADLRAREATAKDPARLEQRAVDLVAKARAEAAVTVARADIRANAVNARVDARVDTLQAVAAYDRAVIAALALPDRTQQTAAITAARTDLRAAIDRPISGRAIDRLDDRLGLEGTPTAVASRGIGFDS